MDKLKKYLEEKGETQMDFAARSGVPQPTISRIVNGGRTSPDNALRIEIATNGAIKRDELLYPDRPDLWEDAA